MRMLLRETPCKEINSARMDKNSLLVFAFRMCFYGGLSFAMNSKRVKRVFRGYEMWANQVYHYKAFEYSVWVGETWTCAEVVAWWNLWGFAPPDIGTRHLISGERNPGCFNNPSHFECGGTLLTPRIVHSACHCYTLPFVRDPRWLVGKWHLNQEMVNHYQVFMGSVYTADMLYPIQSEKVELHPLCGKFNFQPSYIRYDFAWIFLTKSVPDGTGVVTAAWGRKLDYAGPYKQMEIIQDFDKILGENQVCLILGFGPAFGDSDDDLAKLERMKHGYVQIMNWWACHRWLVDTYRQRFPNMTWLQHNFRNSYNESDSWACARLMPKLRQHTNPGDSGFPVSCNGQYFAVVSQTSIDTIINRGVELMDIYAPIKYDLRATAVEYRRQFEEEMASIDNDFFQGLADLAMPIFRSLKIPSKSPVHSVAATYVQNGASHSHPFTAQFCFVSIAMMVFCRPHG